MATVNRLVLVLIGLTCATPAVAQPFVYVATFGSNPVQTSSCIGGGCEGPSYKLLNGATGTVLPGTVLASFSNTDFIRGMVLARDGKMLYLSTRSEILTVDTATSDIIRRMTLSSSPGELAASASGDRLFVAMPTENAVRVLDSATLATTTSVAVGNGPASVEISPDGTVLFVANAGTDTVSRISTASLTVTGIVTVGAQPTAIAFDRTGARLFAVSAGLRQVSIIDVATTSVTGTIPSWDSAKPPPRDVVVTPDGKRLFISLAPTPGVFGGGSSSGELLVADLGTNTNVGSIAAQRPWGLDVDTSGAVYVGTADGVSVIDSETLSVARQYPVGVSPKFVVIARMTNCQFESSFSPAAVPAAGGIMSVVVGADAACPWQLTGVLDWIHAAQPLSGTGPTTLTLTVSPTSSPRRATFALGPQRAGLEQTVPAMAIDVPNGSTLAQTASINGWALELDATPVGSRGFSSGVSVVHAWAFPIGGGSPVFVGSATTSRSRLDVAAYFGFTYNPTGFTIPLAALPAGAYQIVCYARGLLTQQFDQSASVTLTVARSSPTVIIDVPAPNGQTLLPVFIISGWAVDWGTAGTGVDVVHAWAIPASGAPTFLGAATYGSARADVASLFGPQFEPSGYSLTASVSPGTYTLAVFAHSTVTGEFSGIAYRPIVIPPTTRMSIASLGAPVTGPFNITGWAIDLAASAGTGVDTVHVWAVPATGGAPTFLGAVSSFTANSNVAVTYGNHFLNSGFQLSGVTLPPGTYQVSVYAHSTVADAFNNSLTTTIVVR